MIQHIGTFLRSDGKIERKPFVCNLPSRREKIQGSTERVTNKYGSALMLIFILNYGKHSIKHFYEFLKKILIK